MWVYDSDLEQMVQRDITFVPGLYKIFDEIIGKNFNIMSTSRVEKKTTNRLKIDTPFGGMVKNTNFKCTIKPFAV